MIETLFINPITIWIKWICKKLYFQFKYNKYHLKIGYLSDVVGCKFGYFNNIYSNVLLYHVELGDFSYVNSNSRMNRTKVGKFTAIGENVMCGIGKHPSKTFVSIHPIFYSTQKQSQITFSDKDYFEEFSPIEIGNDVWIGARAIIMDGVCIGDGAIIGAGAIVTKDVPPYAIVVGAPAKIIRYRFDEQQIEFLRNFQWWNKDIGWLRQHYKEFHDIKNFMNTSDQ